MRILVTGASGQLGGYLLRELHQRGLSALAWSGSRAGELFGYPFQAIELADADAVSRAFAQSAPDVVIHAAAIAKISDCHRDPDRAHRVNVEATTRLSDLCRAARVRLVYVSTDLVFDGRRGNYREEDEARPLSVYGRSKLGGEQAALASPLGVVARVSLMYGPSIVGRPSFFDEQLLALRASRPIKLFTDEWRTPLDLPTASSSLVALALSEQTGLFHIGGPERLTRWQLGQEIVTWLGVGSGCIMAANQADVPAAEPRPRDVSLDSSKWRTAFPEHPWPGVRQALWQMNV